MATLPIVAPEVQSGIDALAAYLCTEGYSPHARGIILAHVASEGTLEGLVAAGALEPADEAAAEGAYVDGLEPVSTTDAAWDEHGADPGRGPVYLDVESILAACGMHRTARKLFGRNSLAPTLIAIPPELDADEDEIARLVDAWEIRHDAEMAALDAGRPAPEPEVYDPTPEDEAYYAELMSEDFALTEYGGMLPPIRGGSPAPDPEADRVAEMRAWYDAHPISEFNRERTD